MCGAIVRASVRWNAFDGVAFVFNLNINIMNWQHQTNIEHNGNYVNELFVSEKLDDLLARIKFIEGETFLTGFHDKYQG